MLVKVGLLRESHSTVFKIALVRLFVGVDSEVIEKVMPFSEHFSLTSSMCASKHPNDMPFVILRPVLIDHKVL